MPLIIHIGPPKTATTTIQNSLYKADQNNSLKEENTKYLFNSLCNNDILFFCAHINSPIPRQYNQPNSLKAEEYKKNANIFIKNLKESHKKNNVYISSSEYLWRMNIAEIKALKKALNQIDEDIEILCFIRDPIQHILSGMAENIKHRIALKDPNKYVNTFDQINSWKSVFGSNFHVYSFESTFKVEGGIVGYFSNIIRELLKKKGIKNNIRLSTFGESKNVSPCIEMLKAIQMYRVKYKLEESVYSPDLNRARNKISELAIGLGNKPEYSEIAKTFFINKNQNLYELLESKYKFKFKYDWKSYIDVDNYKNLKNIVWSFDNIIKSYNKDLSALFLLNLEIETCKVLISKPKFINLSALPRNLKLIFRFIKKYLWLTKFLNKIFSKISKVIFRLSKIIFKIFKKIKFDFINSIKNIIGKN